MDKKEYDRDLTVFIPLAEITTDFSMLHRWLGELSELRDLYE